MRKVINKYSKLLLLLFVLSAIATSCGNKEDKSMDKMLKKLEKYRAQKEELDFQIRQLESEITALGDSSLLVKKEEGVLVKVKPVKTVHFKHYVEVQGTAASDQNISVSPEQGGRIMKVYVDEGMKVRRGQLLVKIDDEIIRKNIEELKTALDLASAVYERQKNLWDKKIGSELQYLQSKNNKESLENKLSTANSQLAMTNVKSPIAGIVDLVMVKEGEMASPGYGVVRVVNLNEIKVSASAAETFVGKVQKGDSVVIKFPAIGLERKARVSYIGQVINPNNRTFSIEVDLKNKDNVLKPNMLAVIQFVDYDRKNSQVVPTNIIQYIGEDKYVFVSTKEGKIKKSRKVKVESGRSYNGMTEVLSGLKGDEEIIVAGFNDIADGDLLNVTEN